MIGSDQQPGLPADQIERSSAMRTFRQDDARRNRRRIGFLVVLLVVIFLVCLCQISSSAGGIHFYSPWEVLTSLPDYIRLYTGSVFGLTDVNDWSDAYAANPNLAGIGNRAGVTLITAVCGALLALAGSLYQDVFRNPIAAPTMLGVSNGVQLGVIILVMQFGTAAATMTGLYYLYTYLGAVIILLIVLGAGKLTSGKGRFNVVDMLLVGSIVSQLCAFVTTYLSTYFIDDDAWETFYEITEMTSVNTEFISYLSLIITVLVALIPVFLFRFSMNMVSFTDEEAKLAGVNPSWLRIVALVCATIMTLTAQVHCGMISMITLVVPQLSRVFLGADFKQQFWGNMLIGMILLLICRFIVGCIPFVEEGMSIGTVVSFVLLPFYVWMIARAQQGWTE